MDQKPRDPADATAHDPLLTDEVPRAIFSLTTDGIVVVDRDMRIVAVNPGAEALFGWRAEELAGAPLGELIPRHLRARHEQHVADFAGSQAQARRMGERSAVTGLRRDGTSFPADASIVRVGDGRQTLVAAIVRDLTEPQARERHARDSDRRFRAIFDRTFQSMAILTPDGRIDEINRSSLQFAGVQLSEAKGKALEEAAWFAGDPATQAEVRNAVRRAAAGEVVRRHLKLSNAQQARRWVDFSVKPIFDEAGAVVLLVAEGRDITDLVELNHTLQRNEARLRNAQRLGRMGSWDWDVATNEVVWSEEVYRLLDLEPSTDPLTLDDFVRMVHPDDRARIRDARNLAFETGATYEIDHRIELPGGEHRVVHEHGEIVRDLDGRPVRMEGIVQDITQQKEAEQALIAARNEAVNASAAKSRFLATMSHELRTPLNAIIGFSQIMAEGTVGPASIDQYREYSLDILKSGRHLLQIINSVLDVAQAEANSIKLHEEWVDLDVLLKDSLDLVGPGIDQRQTAMVVDSSARGLQLFADPYLCRQILVNLISNSMKFSTVGSRIELRVRRQDEGLAIIVADSGIGIPDSAIPRVTEAFFQSDGGPGRRHEGTGLGLYLVRSFLALHGGHLAIESTVGVGTTATAWLPGDRLRQGSSEGPQNQPD